MPTSTGVITFSSMSFTVEIRVMLIVYYAKLRENSKTNKACTSGKILKALLIQQSTIIKDYLLNSILYTFH